jgi:hypothetical protein
MELARSERFVTNNLEGGTLLVVADFLNGSGNVLDFAEAIASRYNARLELLQVVDPGRKTRPNFDTSAAARSNLEKFARTMRTMGSGAVSLLSFGSPEDLIVKRASAMRAKLIIFPLIGSSTDPSRKKLAGRLAKRCACPVVAFPLEAPQANPTELARARGLRVLIHRLFGRKRGSFVPASNFESKTVPIFRGA